MKKNWILCSYISLILCSTIGFSQITISEIMFDPSASEHYYEFIEIYNLSDSESIDLTDWSISDGQDFDKIVSVVDAIVLPSNQFAIILDPGYFENDAIYDILIPDAALILTIDGATFGSGGLSNSMAETISLLDQNDNPVSEYTYSLDNAPGHSDEKIELSGENLSENWANSISVHGTPGFRNSVSPLGIDLEVSFDFIPDSPGPNDPVIIDVHIANIGTEPISDYSLTVFEDRNLDSVGVENEIIFQKKNISTILESENSLQMQVNLGTLHSGTFLYIVNVSAVNDMNSENNQVLKYLTIHYKKNALIINEVMFRPNSGEPEWIELYNLSDTAIDLLNWKISDSRTDTRVKVSEQPIFIQPDTFMILSQRVDNGFEFTVPHIILDNWSALNNSGDAVVLYDLSGTTIDSIYYSGDWSTEQGISLERFEYARSSADAANWAPCQDVEGSTPGRYNSISAKEFDLRIDDLTFMKQNAGESDVLVSAKVINAGRQGISGFTVSFYHDINSDFTPEDLERIGIVSNYGHLSRFDSVIVTALWESVPPGMQHILGVVSCAQDQNAANDTTFGTFNESFPSQSIVINEI
ncbi:hypothetical protein GF337_02035, partial [candidate division KSB1 bacterium]|nr:hypothetical protein [candidate division KSB1 bacterium]